MVSLLVFLVAEQPTLKKAQCQKQKAKREREKRKERKKSLTSVK